MAQNRKSSTKERVLSLDRPNIAVIINYPRFLKLKGCQNIDLAVLSNRQVWIIYQSLTGRIGFQSSPLLSLRAEIAVCVQRGDEERREDQRGRRARVDGAVLDGISESFGDKKLRRKNIQYLQLYINKFNIDPYFLLQNQNSDWFTVQLNHSWYK